MKTRSGAGFWLTVVMLTLALMGLTAAGGLAACNPTSAQIDAMEQASATAGIDVATHCVLGSVGRCGDALAEGGLLPYAECLLHEATPCAVMVAIGYAVDIGQILAQGAPGDGGPGRERTGTRSGALLQVEKAASSLLPIGARACVELHLRTCADGDAQCATGVVADCLNTTAQPLLLRPGGGGS